MEKKTGTLTHGWVLAARQQNAHCTLAIQLFKKHISSLYLCIPRFFWASKWSTFWFVKTALFWCIAVSWLSPTDFFSVKRDSRVVHKFSIHEFSFTFLKSFKVCFHKLKGEHWYCLCSSYRFEASYMAWATISRPLWPGKLYLIYHAAATQIQANIGHAASTPIGYPDFEQFKFMTMLCEDTRLKRRDSQAHLLYKTFHRVEPWTALLTCKLCMCPGIVVARHKWVLSARGTLWLQLHRGIQVRAGREPHGPNGGLTPAQFEQFPCAVCAHPNCHLQDMTVEYTIKGIAASFCDALWIQQTSWILWTASI